jgi:hypothetical protein
MKMHCLEVWSKGRKTSVLGLLCYTLKVVLPGDRVVLLFNISWQAYNSCQAYKILKRLQLLDLQAVEQIIKIKYHFFDAT